MNQVDGMLHGPAFQFKPSISGDKSVSIVKDAAIANCQHANGRIISQFFADQYTDGWMHDFDSKQTFTIPLQFSEPAVVMLYCIDGSAEILTRNQLLKLEQRSAYLLNMQPRAHQLRIAPGKTKLLFLMVSNSMLTFIDEKKVSSPYGDTPFCSLHEEQYEQLQELYQQSSEGELWRLKRQVLLLDLFFRCMEHLGSPYRPMQEGLEQQDYIIVRKVHEYITANIDKKLSVNVLAARFGVHPMQLRRMYKKVFHRHIADYIRELRLSRAERLLAGTAMPVQEIAWEVGYESAAGFSRVFAKNYNATPSNFRRDIPGI